MANTNPIDVDNNEPAEDVLQHAEDLVRELQKGNEEKVASILETISIARDKTLFEEVGKMTRQLHDALEAFRQDSRIDDLAEHDIPDARERLTYVITMTQQSADRTLSAVENTMPVAERISERAGSLGASWKKFRHRKLTADEFRTLAGEIDEFLTDITDDSTVMKNNLNDVLMAQEFQDLTGQIITRVITLVEEVEGNLVELIRLTGDRFNGASDKPESSGIEAEGPQIPGVGSNDVVSSQDDVDDLLSSLGF